MSENKPEGPIEPNVSPKVADIQHAHTERQLVKVVLGGYEGTKDPVPIIKRIRRGGNIVLKKMGEADGQT